MKEKIEEHIEDRDLMYIKSDIGFQSRYSLMTEDYKPLILRVQELEKVVAALQEHLGVTVVKEQYVAKPKPIEREKI